LKELLYILVIPLASLAGLAAFTTWWAASVYVLVIALFAAYAAKRHEKRHRQESLDDRLSEERMESAREKLIEEFRS
jgi:membrane protein implicated in regulation of membrane protease activity